MTHTTEAPTTIMTTTSPAYRPGATTVHRKLDRRKFATLATVSSAGWPHAAGILYELDGDALFLNTLASSRKARNIAANRNVALSIPIRRVPVGPPSSVQFQSTAQVLAVNDSIVQSLIADGKLKSLTSHGELELDGSVFIRIALPQRLHTYGLGMSLRTLIRDPLSAAGTVDLGELIGTRS